MLDTGTQVVHIKYMQFSKKYYYVYIMASKRNGTLYIGFTSNLVQRVFEHKHQKLKKKLKDGIIVAKKETSRIENSEVGSTNCTFL